MASSLARTHTVQFKHSDIRFFINGMVVLHASPMEYLR